MDLQPGRFLESVHDTPNLPPASLIILNQPLPPFSTFKKLWDHTTYRICADGGANRLYDLFDGNPDESRESHVWFPSDYLPRFATKEIQVPDIIIGDLDSLRPDTRQWYSEKSGSRVVEDSDQYSTDFGKAMKVLTKGYAHLADLPRLPALGKGGLQDIIILGTISGRVDQGIGLLHEIYRESQSHSAGSDTPVRMWLFSEQNVSFLLHKGRNVISGINPKVKNHVKNDRSTGC